MSVKNQISEMIAFKRLRKNVKKKRITISLDIDALNDIERKVSNNKEWFKYINRSEQIDYIINCFNNMLNQVENE